jgi:hypothetical protein
LISLATRPLGPNLEGNRLVKLSITHK